MDESSYTFEVKTLEELLTAASLIEDGDKAHISGKRLKEVAVEAVALRDDLIRCHSLCTEMGAPNLGGGTKGLIKRLEFIKAKQG